MKLKEILKPKYRILPVYRDNSKIGFTVQVKYWWLGLWVTVNVHSIIKNMNEEDTMVLTNPVFHDMKEAIDYIENRKTVYK